LNFSTIDTVIFLAYCSLIIGVGIYVSREKKGHEKDSKDYFLAGKSLTWWAVGASLIASNISAEQFIGMSGSGYAIGMAIASYEWMGAITLLVVAKFFLPIYLKEGIYTMPQFLEHRYDGRVKTIMAIFWLFVYVFVNLTSVIYLGALAMQTIMGVDMSTAIIGLVLFAAIYSIYGGLKAVAWTDVIQVVFLVGGGLITTVMALQALGEGQGIFAGFSRLFTEIPERFSMIVERGEITLPDGRDAYLDLPGLSVLIGGMWVANLYYWGFNQYIIQRALAAKSLQEAQKGIAFAGYLKLIIPLIVVIPGIAAFALHADISRSDEAYPWLLNEFVGPGFKGLAFAALIAAVVSSLASMINSTSTIFTMDIYKYFINKNASERQLVKTGRIVSVSALLIAALIAPQLATLDQVFQYIQDFTGFVSPGIVAIFLFGFFWKRTTSNAAIATAIISVIASFLFKALLPDIPFMDRMGLVFLASSAILIGVSLLDKKHEPKGFELTKKTFITGTTFNVMSTVLVLIIALLYALFW
jgi:SSS family solute:Na+ symporter